MNVERILGIGFAIMLFFVITLTQCCTMTHEPPKTVRVKIIESSGAIGRSIFGDKLGTTLVELPDGTRQLLNGKWGKDGEMVTMKLIDGKAQP